MNGTTTIVVEEPLKHLIEWAQPFSEITDYKILRVVVMSMTAIAVLMGFPGNLLVIASILFEKSLRQLHHVFIVNLALCDLGVIVMDIFFLLGASYGSEFYEERKFLCEFSGFICMLSCFGSLWSIMFIAINRYLFILHNPIYKKVFNVKGTIVAVVLLWCCVCLLDLANWPFIGLGEHDFSFLGLHCGFTATGNLVYNTFVYSGLAVVFPATVIFIAYAKILRKTQQLSDKLATTAGSVVIKKRQQEQKQLTRSLIIIFAMFCVCWFPMGCIVFLIGLGSSVVLTIPLPFPVLFEFLAHLNSALNFIVLGLTHSGFRKAYVKIFGAILRCNVVKNVEKTPSGHKEEAK